METPTIVRQTKDYLLVKIPLPKARDRVSFDAPKKIGKLTKKEQKLWDIIQEGEEEYRAGKTIRAQSIDKARAIYHEREKNK